jgi:hypothetical protein
MLFLLLILGCTARSPTPSEQPAATDAASSAQTMEKWEDSVELDRACTTEEDCALSFRYVAGNGRCCNSCSPIAVNAATDAAIDAVCAEHRAEHGECTIMKKCAVPEVGCVKGSCVITGTKK